MREMIRAVARQEIQRVMAAVKHPRNAIITSVDPDTYSAKVRYEPHDPDDEGNGESGWVPIQAVATGKGFGVYSVPNVGDPVEVAFQEGDHMTGRIQQRHASEQNQPPQGMKAGEHWTVHGNGAVMAFKQDGSVFIGGAGTMPQRQGKDASTGKDGQSAQNQQPQGKQAFTLTPDGAFTFAHKSGGQISMDKDGNVTITAKDKGVTVNAGSGGITYKGASHTFNGPISADGGITAAGQVQGASVMSGTRTL